jgi:putative FmdB family regulatory protein
VPTYDYQCRSCGIVTEVIHAMTKDGPTICERCGGELRRVLYPARIIFKGSGFYRTDSRASDDGASAKKTSPAAAPADGGTASSSGSSGKTTTGGSTDKSTTGGSTDKSTTGGSRDPKGSTSSDTSG